MTATVKNFYSDRGLEEAVRERFGLVKPGEGEIKIVRAKTEEGAEEQESDNAFDRLFNAFFAW